MNAYARVDEMRARWLCPPEPRRGRYKCMICGHQSADVRHFELDLGVICEDCLQEHTLPYDCYPEIGEERRRCSMCGFPCEEEVTIICGRAFCRDCIEEAKL